MNGTYLGFRQEKECEDKSKQGDATEHPANSELNVGDHVWNNKIGHKSPDDIPGTPKSLGFLSERSRRDLTAEEIGD